MTAGNEEQLVSNVFHRKTPVDEKAKERKVESSQLSLVLVSSVLFDFYIPLIDFLTVCFGFKRTA